MASNNKIKLRLESRTELASNARMQLNFTDVSSNIQNNSPGSFGGVTLAGNWEKADALALEVGKTYELNLVESTDSSDAPA